MVGIVWLTTTALFLLALQEAKPRFGATTRVHWFLARPGACVGSAKEFPSGAVPLATLPVTRFPPLLSSKSVHFTRRTISSSRTMLDARGRRANSFQPFGQVEDSIP